MSERTPIETALTLEEWAMRGYFPTGMHLGVTLKTDGNGNEYLNIQDKPHHTAYAFDDKDRHALAAICLHNQPYGFNHEDLRLLISAAYEFGLRHQTDFAAALHRIAWKIEALLPPEVPHE